MKMICDACRTGPAGIEGHPHLLVQALGNSWMAFNCDRCEALWSRTSRPDRYVWARIPKRQRLEGVHIPRRQDAPLF